MSDKSGPSMTTDATAEAKDADKPPPSASGASAAGVSKSESPRPGEAKPDDAKAAEAKADDAEPRSSPKPSKASPAPPAVEAKDEADKVASPRPAAVEAKPKASQEIKVRLFGRTDVGQVREHNEDNFIVADLSKGSRGLMESDRMQLVGERGTLLGVCDGMGGAAAGEVASQLAVDIIHQKMSLGDAPRNRDDLALRLVAAIEAAGLRIFSEAKLDRTRRGMGTTATVAAVMDDHLFLGQVGDSRAYILRSDRLVQVTRDQSLVNQLIEAGQLTEEEAETFEHNNIILQALGTSDSVQVDLTYVLLRKGDVMLLCSDGLSGMVRNDEIREVLRSVEEPLEACKVLTDRANQAGGHDNITVVIARFEGDGLEEPRKEDIEGLKYLKYPLPEPPPMHAATVPEPSRRVKELSQAKVSSRPPPKLWGASAPPDIEVSEDTEGLEGYDDIDDRGSRRGDEPIVLPTDNAPQWLVIMMIASAVACVMIAGYYLLK